MKKISSTILLFFFALLLFLLGFVGIWTFSLLKEETRGRTFQFELLQTEVIGKSLMEQIGRAQASLSDLGTTPQERKNLPFDQVIPVKMEQGLWRVNSQTPVDETIQKAVDGLVGIGNQIHSFSSDKHLLLLAKLTPPNGVLAILNITKIYQDCEGQPVGAINADGELLFACDPTLKERLKLTDGKTMARVKDSKFSAGSFETEEPNSFLYSYYQPSTLLSVVGITPTKVAFRPAYFLVLRMILLMLCGLGIAVLISVFLSRKITGPIELVTLATERISKGEFDFPIEVKSKNEMRTLADAVRNMSQRIKKLIQSEIEKSKIEAQLEVAATIQRTLLPPTSVTLSDYKLDSLYLPADQCGGDWWSYLDLGPKLVLLIGDVTGHGYPSALLVAATRGGIALIESELEKLSPDQINPAQILKTLNRVVFDSAQAKLGMTALCFVIDKASGDFTIASAAHQAPYYVKRESNEVELLSSPGAVLGTKREYSETFNELTGTLLPTERIVLSTDGIQDLGPEEKMLGRKGIFKFFKSNALTNSDDLIQKVESELIPQNGGIPLRDDITVVILERTAHA